MKKKLICLLLALTMLCAAFTSCGEKSDEDTLKDITDEASEQTVTLSMYLVSESKVSQAVEEEIEAAVNAITQSNFRIKLDLRYFTEDEYYDILNDHLIKSYEDYLNNDYEEEEEDEEGAQTEAETILNELGIPELKYPEISDHQVDIFYFSGYDKLSYYYDGGYLAMLDAYTTSLKADVFAPFLTYMKSLNGGVPAIATNQVIGEYSFLLLNKEALKDANYSVSDITSVYDDNCKDFVELIASDYRNDYVPFYSEGNIYNAPGLHYWGVNNGAFDTGFSVLGAVDGQTWKYKELGAAVTPTNILGNDIFKNHVLTIKGYEYNGYYATNDEIAANKDFAAGYIVGGAEVWEEYGDEYEIITLSRPIFTTKTLYSDMFGVSAFSSSENACMDVVTYMNTNKEFKNLLLYGVEGKHYELVESDDYVDENGDPYMLVERYTDENGNLVYPMDNYKTGNTFLAMPEVGQNPNWVKYAQIQNRDAYISLILGFEIGMIDYEFDLDQFEDIAKLSAGAIEAMEACKTVEELEKCINSQRNRVNMNESFRLMTTDDDPEAKHGFDLDSFAEYYRDWTIAMNIFQPKEDT